MKNNIFKPLGLFLIAIFILSAVIIVVRGIKIPSFLPKKEEQKKVFQEEKIQEKNGKITITYSDLNLFFADCCSSTIKNVKTSQDNDSIKVSGQAILPFPADFEGNVSLYAESGQVKARISNLKLGKIETPKALEENITPLIQKGLDEKINGKYKVKDVKITNKGIEITL